MLNALKNLYVKLGGALTDTFTGIEGGKPVGDYILKSNVVAACAEKGGASRFTVNFAEEKDHPITVTDDKGNALTISQIVAAVDEGKSVIGKFADPSSGVMMYLNVLMATAVEDFGIVAFTALKIENGTGVVIEFAGSNDGEGDVWQKVEVELQAAST